MGYINGITWNTLHGIHYITWDTLMGLPTFLAMKNLGVASFETVNL